MYKTFIVLLTLMIGCLSYSQKIEVISETIQNAQPDYDRLDSIAKTLKYNGGDVVRVLVRFAINEEGELVDIKTRGPHKTLEDEAIRILKLVPKLDPPMENGQPTRTEFSMPINFKIETSAERKKRLRKAKRKRKG